MAGNAGAHTKKVEEPGAVWCEQPRLKIEMKEGLRFRALVPAQELEKCFAAKMVDDARGNINLARMIGTEGVAMDESAREVLGGRETICFVDETGIEIDACEFDSLGRQRSVGGEPADVVTDAAADIHDAKRPGESAGTNCGDGRAENFSDAWAVVELLGKPLHFPVNGDEQAIDFAGIEESVWCGERFDSAKGLPVAIF